ncbi:MAG TPA: HPr family phosphocarrier protein [Treponemataceae bacterium]|nr:MAG: Phosphocarrier protein HPr [Spirochaetes bacterium ADurb.Bin269]HOC30010.1 HPr family phosphocarrier protein [Treponemataceae bacterium]HQL33089.1 HPr family phosphocarrier protein [Treponemataceae bacterium]
MVEKNITIANPSGLHTRPAKRIVDVARAFASEITFIKEGRDGSAKNLLKLMKLGITLGNTITVRCEGEDESAALESISAALASLSE